MRARRWRDRVLNLMFGVALLAGLSGSLLLAVMLVARGMDRIDSWLSVLGMWLTIGGALATLVMGYLRGRAVTRHPPGADPATDAEQLIRATEELQVAVGEQWCKEAKARSLGDPDPMPVRWRLSDPRVMDPGEQAAPVFMLFSGRGDRIPALTDQFRRLLPGRLVIVGGPGSGKTTLAMQLVVQLLTDWQSGEPVPVLFSLFGWDPHTQPRVQDWLAAQLTQTYPARSGRDSAQKLADQGRLLLVLDGLDEIPADRRGKVIEALNASLQPDTGVILTSRTTEYAESEHRCGRLIGAVAIEPEPFTAREAAGYLEDRLPRRTGDSWRAVLTALREGTAGSLAEVVASPLGLWQTGHHCGQRRHRTKCGPAGWAAVRAVEREAGWAFGRTGVRAGLLVSVRVVEVKTCWPGFVLASLWLVARRRLPLRLMGFLDEAYQLGLLRIVGPVYQFRHAALQHHLAPPVEALRW